MNDSPDPAPSQPPAADAVPERSATRGSLLVIFLTVFIDLLGFAMVLPLLPIYANQFTTDASGFQLGMLMASFSIMQFLFAPLWGRLSDSVGRRPVLMVGLAGSMVFYALFGIATVWESLTLLFVARIGAGIAGATIPTAQAYIADTTTQANRSKGMALIGMAFGLGFTFGPLLGGLAVPDRAARPGPWPGYVAAALSATALLLAVFLLPESKPPGAAARRESRFGLGNLRQAFQVASIPLVLLAILLCVFSFANFETTLSLLINGGANHGGKDLGPFQFSWRQVCLTYAFIGFTLALVQGGLVRRMAGRVHEGWLAAGGAAVQIGGFLAMLLAIAQGSTTVLFAALALVVTGFSFMQPSLNGLLSRRTDPRRQGVVLGVGQSVSSLARILGAGLGIPMLKQGLNIPYVAAAGLMTLGMIVVAIAAVRGADYVGDVEVPAAEGGAAAPQSH